MKDESSPYPWGTSRRSTPSPHTPQPRYLSLKDRGTSVSLPTIVGAGGGDKWKGGGMKMLEVRLAGSVRRKHT